MLTFYNAQTTNLTVVDKKNEMYVVNSYSTTLFQIVTEPKYHKRCSPTLPQNYRAQDFMLDGWEVRSYEIIVSCQQHNVGTKWVSPIYTNKCN